MATNIDDWVWYASTDETGFTRNTAAIRPDITKAEAALIIADLEALVR